MCVCIYRYRRLSRKPHRIIITVNNNIIILLWKNDEVLITISPIRLILSIVNIVVSYRQRLRYTYNLSATTYSRYGIKLAVAQYNISAAFHFHIINTTV